ncbi:hypothetical protein ACH4F6_15190 [Streptomyces sp. NPDC017936]|uniref:hypothetical protein n=1 Tax=Streptomyces sp. NPDC017936 TaxID=3365016 RepID=UPI0037989FC9
MRANSRTPRSRSGPRIRWDRRRGTHPRTCLLVGLWHPETTVPERKALVAAVTEIRELLGEE